MSLDLQSLRTAKAALDEGLLDAQDYATVKNSFIKAQSIKAGVEAGFISDADYSEARKAFFGGLGIIHGNSATPNTTTAAVVEQRDFATPEATRTTGAGAATRAPVTASPAAAATPTPAVTAQAAPRAPPPVTVPQSAPTPDADGPESTTGGSIVPTPTGLADRGGAQTVADKVCQHAVATAAAFPRTSWTFPRDQNLVS
jgi:cofilin